MLCPNCNKDLGNLKPQDAVRCWFCEYRFDSRPVPQLETSKQLTSRDSVQEGNVDFDRRSISIRYRDAYLVGRTVNASGAIVKTLSFIFTVFIFAGALIAGTMLQSSYPLLLGLIVAAGVGGLGYVMGVVVSSLGQIQMATLDSAVYGSTFLTNDDRAEILSIPKARPRSV